ncbi:hypothetical protein ASPZODRAFT_1973151 [Penicilliopsis zonata CBS 506.65]|uniref:Zn(2)-C6 fungal-type domain-containing protein n=1 Tax=Penicilliopsis zonata CBS 506.65 TaxID=1073090 RepID=A0A1L9SHC6_9EURO|nr:hypothetical protein ASPZODRAFT_1973151 [Penicilliopsis zonata CBS 506.65]OJJ46568.1 hypothetical protein ASPZODRAFT_1973151 [Penicilliopsis zonata CBS 506.65]
MSATKSVLPVEGDDGHAHSAKRKNVSIACNNCRSRRLKCSATLPSCMRCTENGKICIYEQDDNRKKAVWKSRVDRLQAENERLKSIIERLKGSTDADAAQLLQQLRGGDSDSTSASSMRTAKDSSSPGQTPPTEPSMSQDATMPTMPPDSIGEILMQAVGPDPDAFIAEVKVSNLPPEQLTRQAIHAFFSCGATLFYITTEEEAAALITEVYHSDTIDTEDICDMCALAAIGSQYAVTQIPSAMRDLYFRYACALMHGTMEKDDMRSMRVFICLSMVSIMEKRQRAPRLIAYGLKIARYNLLGRIHSAEEETWPEWARLMRTLAFMECWLSFTLGFSFKLTNKDMVLISQLRVEDPDVVSADLIQMQMSRIALLCAQIYSEICHMKEPAWETVNERLRQADRWSQELPAALQLQTLLQVGDDGLSAPRRRALFLVHMIHIGSHVLLYQHVLGTTWRTVTAGDPFSVMGFLQSSACIHSAYTAVTRQQSQMCFMLYRQNGVFQRCWLVMW